MNKNEKYTGFAIALAWPDTYCKQPGAWYDPLTLILGVNNNNYYKVGHAALVLIDSIKEKALYFDFGRYHTPYQHGRVRGANTDDDLFMHTKPVISADGLEIENYNEILLELQNNAACHGEGKLHASYTLINFNKAISKVKEMQTNSPLPYGPFKYKGSNCSRFVQTAILAGEPTLGHLLKLKYKIPFTPTPVSNVNALEHVTVVPKKLKGEPFCPIKKLDKELLLSTLPAPTRHNNIPENAQWLGGEGAGSWFSFEINDNILQVARYSPMGVLECKGIYENKAALEEIKKHNSIKITYPSNCKSVYLKANNKEYTFYRAK